MPFAHADCASVAQESHQEEWRRLPWHPSIEVSSHGRVRRDGKLSKQWPAGAGYMKFCLPSGTVHAVSRAVLLAFVGPAPTPRHEAAHEDGNPGNNRLDNLFWKTPKENAEDKFRHQTLNLGSRNGKAKLTEEQAREIHNLLIAGHKQKDIAAKYGVSQGTVHFIKTGKAWSFAITGQRNIPLASR